ncbi:hypothetical protein [Subtercola boreus]|uniref:hypothetical protein n=1 Tax=Subtercola boreus TaxID=120213 RepID=UPI0011C033C8|nr:hypothetical protein [Subtercola boreus]
MILFSENVFISYGYLQLVSGDDDYLDLTDSFKGQSNGLLGGMHSGRLFMLTGTQTGEIPLTVRLGHSDETGWEEIVEAPLAPNSFDVALLDWSGEVVTRFELPEPSYRARWSASGMGDSLDNPGSNERYELSLRPAAFEPDATIRQTSGAARSWRSSLGLV